MGPKEWVRILVVLLFVPFPAIATQHVFSEQDFFPPVLPDIAYTEMELMFIEGMSGQVMNDYEAIFEYDDGEFRIGHLGSSVIQRAPFGKSRFRVILEDTRTPEFDYLSEYYDIEAGKQTITMRPVGSVRGVAYLKGERQAGLEVSYECASYSGSLGETSGLGFYSGHLVQTGPCKIRVEKGEFYAEEEVRIARGEMLDVDLQLKTGGLGKLVYVLGIANFLLIGAIIDMLSGNKIGKKLLAKRKKPPKAEGQKAPEIGEAEAPDAMVAEGASPEEPAPRKAESEEKIEKIRTILRTLSGRQRKIIEFLLANGGEAPQSRIYHELEIPKTSLIREIASLEGRNLVNCEEFGKTRLLSLPEWFYPPGLKDSEIIFEQEVDVKIDVSDAMRRRMEGLAKKQQNIVRLLLDNGGSLLQAQIQKESGIPKSTLVRLISDLKIKGVVQAIKFRKTKRVELTEKFLGTDITQEKINEAEGNNEAEKNGEKEGNDEN